MKKVTVLFSVLLIIAGIAGYFPSFANGFIWDDRAIIVLNEYIRDWKNLPGIFTTDLHHFSAEESNFYRPLQTLSYAWDYTFWKLDPKGYHMTNTLGHILNAILILFLFAMAGRRSGERESQASWTGFLTALIWVVHPIHTQCVTYASGRADVFVATFILLTVLSHMAGKPILTAAFFVFALFSKEYALVTPVFLLFVDAFFRPEREQWTFGKIWKRYSLVLAVLAIYIILRLTLLSFPSSSSVTAYPGLMARVLTSAKAIMILLGALAAPVKLSFLRNIDWVSPGSDTIAYLSLAAVLGLIGFSFWVRKKDPRISFGLLWFFVSYLPYLNIVPLNANVSEHWMYLSSVGLIYAAICGGSHMARVPRARQVAVCLAVILAVVYGFRLVQRNSDFRDEFTFYEKEIKENPNNARIHYNLGTAYLKQKNYEKGASLLERAVELNPKYALAYGNLGLCYYQWGERGKAIEYFQKAESLSDSLVENPMNLARAYTETGQYDKAIPLLEKTLSLRPDHIGALNGLGIEYGRRGDYDKAEALFKRVLKIDPHDRAAKDNLNLVQELKKKVGAVDGRGL